PTIWATATRWANCARRRGRCRWRWRWRWRWRTQTTRTPSPREPPRACLEVPGRPAAGPDDDRPRWRFVRIQHRYPDETPPCRIAVWTSPRLDRALRDRP